MNNKEYRLLYSIRVGLRRAMRDLKKLYGFGYEEAGKLHDDITIIYNKLIKNNNDNKRFD